MSPKFPSTGPIQKSLTRSDGSKTASYLPSSGDGSIEQIAPLVTDPLIRQYWPLVRARRSTPTSSAPAWRRLDTSWRQSWGLATLEVPQSSVCAGEAFQWFTAHLLARLPEFRACTTKPCANIGGHTMYVAPRTRCPNWRARAIGLRRRFGCGRRPSLAVAVFSRDRLAMTPSFPIAETWEVRLPLQADGDAGPAVERLLELQRGGVRIRSRALVTTLWARLALGDLFIHGIGGAKYDRLTDRLIERFFGIHPPGFMVVSATLLLPVERDPSTADQSRTIERHLRDLAYHPEQSLNGLDGAAAQLVAEKRRWIETPQTVANARQRCRAIREINAALQPRIAQQRQRLLELQTETLHKLGAESILGSREYAFCLYPESTLREFLSTLLHIVE